MPASSQWRARRSVAALLEAHVRLRCETVLSMRRASVLHVSRLACNFRQLQCKCKCACRLSADVMNQNKSTLLAGELAMLSFAMENAEDLVRVLSALSQVLKVVADLSSFDLGSGGAGLARRVAEGRCVAGNRCTETYQSGDHIHHGDTQVQFQSALHSDGQWADSASGLERWPATGSLAN